MQLAMRANLLSAFIKADRRIGYDRARSKEGHSLFINERITAGGHHVLDAFGNPHTDTSTTFLGRKIAMPVALADDVAAVQRARRGALAQFHFLRAQSHGAAQVGLLAALLRA